MFLIYIYLFISAGTSLSTKSKDELSNAHLKIARIKKVCSNSAAICKSNDSSVCATRMTDNKLEYLNFENSCFLFLQNMCKYYGKEYSIVSSGYCFDYFKLRRHNVEETTKTTPIMFLNTNKDKILREQTHSTLYDIDTAFDNHICPMSCPNVYNPVCVAANRGHGLYYKFFTFVNHCEGDLYYCKNWMEFGPPPDEDEIVSSSPLSWSYCAANRYIQFARFTEMTSSMGHYGWLAGDYRPTHIIEPNQRIKGYG